MPAALVIGITGGFCEEVLFRAFLMTEFAMAGYSNVAQVVIPGFDFLNSATALPWILYFMVTAR